MSLSAQLVQVFPYPPKPFLLARKMYVFLQHAYTFGSDFGSICTCVQTIPDKTNETKSLKLSGYVSFARDSPRTPAPPFNVVPKFQLQPFCTNIERGNGGLFHLLLSGSV